MATLDNAAVIRSLHKAWNEKDMDRYASHGTTDARVTSVPFGVGQTLREFGEGWANAFPDGQIQLVNIAMQGDLVMTEFTGRGTHTGTLKLPSGEVPPTGRRVEMSCVEVYRLRNGKITDGRLYFDSATMLNQLGLSQGMSASATRQRSAGRQAQRRH